MKFLVPFLLVFTLLGCKKKSSPKPPDATNLVFPDENSECTVGADLSSITREVEFRWQMAENTDTYVLSVTNLELNSTQTVSTEAVSAKLPLRKGTPYSWQVRTENDAVIETVVSETWRFYNAGSQLTYPPFPAAILTPELGATVTSNTNNQVTLIWAGSDVDNDINEYQIFFSTSNPPTTLEGSSTATSLQVSVSADERYFWKVITIDREGNSSDSGIHDFRTQ